MNTAFTVLIFGFVAVSAVIGVVAVLFSASPYDRIGESGIAPPAPEEESAEMREDDVRQMLEARRRRRVARGQPAGDVDQELQTMLAPERAAAPEVGAEVRAEALALVAARNARRRRRGEPELDVDAEVAAVLERFGDR